MARDFGALVTALERKAADAAVTAPEREALLTKAAELRETHGINPPRKPPTTPLVASGVGEPGWSIWFTHGFTTTGNASTFVTMTNA